MDFREIHDHDGHWAAFAEQLDGRPVHDLDSEFEAFAESRIEAEFIRNRGPRPYPERCAGVLMHPSSLHGPRASAP